MGGADAPTWPALGSRRAGQVCWPCPRALARSLGLLELARGSGCPRAGRGGREDGRCTPDSTSPHSKFHNYRSPSGRPFEVRDFLVPAAGGYNLAEISNADSKNLINKSKPLSGVFRTVAKFSSISRAPVKAREESPAFVVQKTYFS